jgi:NAD(P)H-nitrite reductase large subunit
MSAMRPDALLCRCECVTVAAVRAAIDEGNATVNDVKRRTRAGMGICQGIFCVDAIARLLVEHGTEATAGEPMTPRPPARLISLADLAESGTAAAPAGGGDGA